MDIHAHGLQPGPSAQFRQIHDEGTADDLAAQPLDQLYPRLRGAARGQQIIDDQYFLTGRDRIIMDLDDRFAIFQLIVFGNHRTGQFALLADRYETKRQLMRNRTAENEAASSSPTTLSIASPA